MNYEEKWKILANLLIELKGNGEEIPVNILKDLRSAKTMIQVLKANSVFPENISRIETYLRSVESYVIFTAEKMGAETAEEWLEQLRNLKTVKKKDRLVGSRFSFGIPCDKSWMRIQISDHIPLVKVKKLIIENRLEFKIQENGYLIVYGKEQNIKSFVKKMITKFRDSIGI
jgi:hypothetical protein